MRRCAEDRRFDHERRRDDPPAAVKLRFALDFDSISGKPEIAFNANGGDGHWTYGDKASALKINTVSGNLNLD